LIFEFFFSLKNGSRSRCICTAQTFLAEPEAQSKDSSHLNSRGNGSGSGASEIGGGDACSGSLVESGRTVALSSGGWRRELPERRKLRPVDGWMILLSWRNTAYDGPWMAGGKGPTLGVDETAGGGVAVELGLP
jgi:hypothetical protein